MFSKSHMANLQSAKVEEERAAMFNMKESSLIISSADTRLREIEREIEFATCMVVSHGENLGKLRAEKQTLTSMLGKLKQEEHGQTKNV